ncbi:MAG: hypothetical protein GXO71_06615 [Caldiserica bacterium]|nr:hypothetical protein [Caldisericota bacterium]
MLKLKDLHTEYITDEKGKKKSVIIPVEDFYELMADIEDLAIVAERRDEPVIPHQDLLKDLKKNGLL